MSGEVCCAGLYTCVHKCISNLKCQNKLTTDPFLVPGQSRIRELQSETLPLKGPRPQDRDIRPLQAAASWCKMNLRSAQIVNVTKIKAVVS